MKPLLILILVLPYLELSSQEFSTFIFVRNALGQIDSVAIGYDPFVEDGYDPTVGEADLTAVPLNDFEIRTGQVHVSKIDPWIEDPLLDSLVQYIGKIEIIPKECLSIIPVSNLEGFISHLNLFIKTDACPITLYWDKSAFINDCLRKSYITDWAVNTLWDAPCCQILDIGKEMLRQVDSLVITRHTGIRVIDNTGDLLLMFTIILEDHLGVANKEINADHAMIIYPNPSNGIVDIQLPERISNSSSITVYDMEGQPIFRSDTVAVGQIQHIDISHVPPGMYIVVSNFNGQIVTRKFICKQ